MMRLSQLIKIEIPELMVLVNKMKLATLYNDGTAEAEGINEDDMENSDNLDG